MLTTSEVVLELGTGAVSGRSGRGELRLAQHEVHDPTPAYVSGLLVTAVVQHILVVTPSVLERVRQNGHR